MGGETGRLGPLGRAFTAVLQKQHKEWTGEPLEAQLRLVMDAFYAGAAAGVHEQRAIQSLMDSGKGQVARARRTALLIELEEHGH